MVWCWSPNEYGIVLTMAPATLPPLFTKNDFRLWAEHHQLYSEDFQDKKGHYKCPNCRKDFDCWLKIGKPSCLGHFYTTGHGIGTISRPNPETVPPVPPVISPHTSAPLVLPTEPMSVRLQKAQETNAALMKRVADLESALLSTASEGGSDNVDDRNAVDNVDNRKAQDNVDEVALTSEEKPFVEHLPTESQTAAVLPMSLPSPVRGQSCSLPASVMAQELEKGVTGGRAGSKFGTVSQKKNDNECCLT